jgi:hypothetical protein
MLCTIAGVLLVLFQCDYRPPFFSLAPGLGNWKVALRLKPAPREVILIKSDEQL